MATLTKTSLRISSLAFDNDEDIPSKYTCEGENINPSIVINEMPEEAKSFALIMDDPDAPGGTFCHWLVWNVPPAEMIKENKVPGIEGKNSFGKIRYSGP